MASTESKKYKIIKNIINDAPHGDINYVSMSFLTPQNIESTKFMDIKGFKVHNGYTHEEIAKNDIKKIKTKNDNHNIFLSEMGKIYVWDNVILSESIEYDDEKLNELEKTRRENIDKLTLMKDQFVNEAKSTNINANTDRMDKIKKRMQKKLYDKGLITKKELEMVQETNKPVSEIKESAAALDKIESELEECFKTDYLDENPETPLKYGCITFYSPKQIGGLKNLCFKIRGLYQTMEQLTDRVEELKKLYPDDNLYHFEVGKWCPYSELHNVDGLLQLKQLNYAMKQHLDNIAVETVEFEKRKDALMNKTKQESDIVRRKNKKEKQEMKRLAKLAKDGKLEPEITETVAPAEIVSLGNTEDDAAIKDILAYIDDPELKDRAVIKDKSQLERVEVDVQNL